MNRTKRASKRIEPKILTWTKMVWEHIGGWKRDKVGPELAAEGRVYSYTLIPLGGGLWDLEWVHGEDVMGLKKPTTLRKAKRYAQQVEEREIEV